jgi:hypothetical protein
VEQGGARAEIATLVFEGKEFTAFGSCVDVERGIISAYVGASVERDDNGVAYLPGRLFRVTTFSGEKIALAVLKSTSRRVRTTWGSHVIEYYSMTFAGFRWHGKKGDGCDLIRFRKGKPITKPAGQPLLVPGDMLGFPKIVGTP